jgi:hypothetical protein
MRNIAHQMRRTGNSKMSVTKSYNVGLPSAGTNVHASKWPAQTVIIPPSRRADLFLRKGPIHTPGSGNLMTGTPKVAKKSSKTKR